jgi:hypothetical protein
VDYTGGRPARMGLLIEHAAAFPNDVRHAKAAFLSSSAG